MFDKYRKTFEYGDKYPSTPYFEKVGLAGKSHLGIDRLMPVGTPIPAPADGRVEHRVTSALGLCIYFYDEFGTLTRFAHNSEFATVEGFVKEGDTMAYSGSSGISTAPHTHYDCWLGGRYTGDFNDTIDPEKYWDAAIKIKVLYTQTGNIKRLDFVRRWYRPYVNIEFDYQLVDDIEIRKTENGKYFKEHDLQMNYMPYADGHDICLLLTPQLDSSTGLFGYFSHDTMFGMYFSTVRLDYARSRKENDADMPDGMIEGTTIHELSHAFDFLMGRKWAGNGDYEEYRRGYDNTHYFDYVQNSLVDNAKTFDSRRMRRSQQSEYMFKYNRGGTTKQKPPHVKNAVYRNWDNTFFAAYTVKGWEKISESDFKRSKAKGVKSYVFSDRSVRWIVANSDIDHNFAIIGIRATRKGGIGRQTMLKTLGWSNKIPKAHLT